MQNDRSWSPELDALIAAPLNHRLLFENDSVRVLDTTIGPGQVTALHTHRWPATLYVLRWSDFVRRNESGETILDTRTITPLAEGSAVWTGPMGPHTLENVGTGELRVIAVELKQAQP